MSLDKVKTLIGTDDERVQIVYDQTEKRLLNQLQRSLPDTEYVPDELEHVVDEVAIARFNRIGSEGMKSENMDGYSVTYTDNDFRPYDDEIQAYIDSQSKGDTQSGIVRFL